MGLDIGRAFGRSFSAIQDNPGTMLGVGIVVAGLPSAIVSALQLAAAPELGEASQPFTALYFVSLAVQLVTGALAYGALVHTAVGTYRNRRVGFGEAIGHGARNLLPLIVISLLLALGLTLGFLALVLPGLFLLVKWSVVIPVQVEERAGIIGSFKRSWALTSDEWLRVFGFLILFILVFFLLFMLVGLIFGLAIAGLSVIAGPAGLLTLALFQLVAGGVSAAITSSVVSALYYGLLTEKEGDTTALQDTFA